MSLINLELGCGPKDKRIPGFTGLDKDYLLEPDIVCDLSKGKIPLPDNSVQRVYACYILEHLDNVMEIIEEIWRVCVAGAIVEVIVPHYGWEGQHKDPSHKTTFCEDSWKYWNSRDPSIPHYGNESKFDLLNYQERINGMWKSKTKAELDFGRMYYRNVIENMTFILQVIK